MKERQFDCLCAGIVVADHLCAPIDHIPAAGELVTTDRLELTIGGCAANVAVDLARLQAQVAIAGVIGRDVFGQFARQCLEEAGVDCNYLTESSTHQTSGTLVINVCSEDRRFIHSVGANAQFQATELTADRIDTCRVLYLGGYCLSENPTADNVATLFQTARKAGVTTVLDVVIPGEGDYWSRLRPVLPWTDVFLPNDDEGRLITGMNESVRQAEAFLDAGAKTVVITCGERGAVLLSDKERLRVRADHVPFVDGTGSGDAFVAGYIYGLLEGQSAPGCLRTGSALGASCVRATGATNGVFNDKELNAFLQNHTLNVDPL